MNTTLNQNRSFNLLVIAGIAVTVIVLIALAVLPKSVATEAIAPAANNASITQFSAEQIQREYILGERYGVTPQEYTLEQALREFWLGERYGQTPQELAHTPVIAVTGTNAGFSIYLLSERTFVDPQAGMATYLASERTSLPVRFTPYQRSEWFGE